MKSNDKEIVLTDDLIIGQGMHKIVYCHPDDATKCLKKLHVTPDDDMERELRYRKIRASKGRKSLLLPEYYGLQKSSIGEVYCFELIRDYNGNISQNLRQYFERLDPKNEREMTILLDALKEFRNEWYKEMVITSDWDPINYLAQRVSEDRIVIRMIDNIGSAVLIPLVLYLDFMAKQHVERHWKKFVDRIHAEYPRLITEKECSYLNID